MDDLDTAVGRLAAQMPGCWKTDYKLAKAREAVLANAVRAVGDGVCQFALDAALPAPQRQRHPNRLFRGDQMPGTTPSATMPSSMSDNYVGGRGYRRRAGIDENGYTAQALLDFLGGVLPTMPEEEVEAFFDGLHNMLGGNGMDQGTTMRLPSNGGRGTAPGEFFGGQTIEGTFAEEDPLGTGPRGNTDSRPRTLRDRRAAQDRRAAYDRRLAQDANAQRYLSETSFFDRFPQAGRIEIWGNR
jgi:hypothetical protein